MLRPGLVLALIGFAPVPAAAQLEPALGIGFVHADERTFFCRDSDPVEALECARDQCHEMAPGQSCVRAAWCFPSGWSAIIRTWRNDLALPSAICGAPTEVAIQRTAAEYCSASDSLMSCDLTHLVDPYGFETAVEGMHFPGGSPANVGTAADEALPDPAAPTSTGSIGAGAVDADDVETGPAEAGSTATE